MNKQIQFIDYLKDSEKYVTGEEMLKRGGLDMAGKEDLEYYLAHPELLEDYKDNYLIFGGYTKLDPYGDRRVAYLLWVGDRWILSWRWLESGFSRRALLVRARKSLDLKVSWPLDELEINGIKYKREGR